LKTKIKYLLFGLKTKKSPKIFFVLKKFVFCCPDPDWEKNPGSGSETLPIGWVAIRWSVGSLGAELAVQAAGYIASLLLAIAFLWQVPTIHLLQ